MLDTLRSQIPGWFSGLILILRPGNILMIFVGTILGGLLASPGGDLSVVVLAGLSMSAIGAAANVFNDWKDVETDRINRPRRPIPSGRLSRRFALVEALILLLFGLAAAGFISIQHGILGICIAVVAGLYNLFLKQISLLGNGVVGILVASSIGFGGLTGTFSAAVGFAMIFAFLTTLSREIVKDIEDFDGDVATGMTTLVSYIGEKSTRYLAAVPVVITLLISPFPYLTTAFSGLYLPALLPADFVLMHVTIQLSKEQIGPDAVSRSLKWAMLLGILALSTAI